jgi:hypothetical protein
MNIPEGTDCQQNALQLEVFGATQKHSRKVPKNIHVLRFFPGLRPRLLKAKQTIQLQRPTPSLVPESFHVPS